MAIKTTPKTGAAKPRAIKSRSAEIVRPKTKTDTAENNATTGGPVMVRRKEMVERIVAASGLKPNAVKTVLDAVLAELGNALSAGEGLNLHPLGKITVSRRKKLDGKEVLNCKIRRKLPQAAPPKPLDKSAE